MQLFTKPSYIYLSYSWRHIMWYSSKNSVHTNMNKQFSGRVSCYWHPDPSCEDHFTYGLCGSSVGSYLYWKHWRMTAFKTWQIVRPWIESNRSLSFNIFFSIICPQIDLPPIIIVYQFKCSYMIWLNNQYASVSVNRWQSFFKR